MKCILLITQESLGLGPKLLMAPAGERLHLIWCTATILIRRWISFILGRQRCILISQKCWPPECFCWHQLPESLNLEKSQGWKKGPFCNAEIRIPEFGEIKSLNKKRPFHNAETAGRNQNPWDWRNQKTKEKETISQYSNPREKSKG